jgi:hypothetical protein
MTVDDQEFDFSWLNYFLDRLKANTVLHNAQYNIGKYENDNYISIKWIELLHRMPLVGRMPRLYTGSGKTPVRILPWLHPIYQDLH